VIAALVTLGAAGTGPAAAAEFEIGEVRGQVDTTVSAGASMRVSGRDCDLIHVTNGGCAVGGEFLNSDDGNLNYDKWDVFANTYKATVDVGFDWKNFGGFFRSSAFYDVITMNTDTKRTDLAGDALYHSNPFDGGVVGMGFNVLDAYVYGNFEPAGRPLDIRVGNQVLSWGENLFFAGGVNAINAVDLPRFRTPGSLLREALLPAPMVRVSAELFQNFSVEAFYQVYWNRFELDPAGSYYTDAGFSQDVVGRGAEASYVLYDPGIDDYQLRLVADFLANQEPVLLPLDPNASLSISAAADIALPPEATEPRPSLLGATPGNLPKTAEEMFEDLHSPVRQVLVTPFELPADLDTGPIDIRGLIAALREQGYFPRVETVLPPFLPFAVPRLHDEKPRSQGQWGVALRYFAEAIRTEFGAYYLRIHDKAPSVGWVVEPGELEVRSSFVDMANDDGSIDLHRVFGLLKQFGGSLADDIPDELVTGMLPPTFQAVGVPTGYFREYPEDINIFGVSAATELFGVAWGAEVSYRDEMPVPIDGETLLRELIETEVPQTGQTIRRSGFVRENKIQAQLNAIATIGPGDPYVGAIVRALQISSIAVTFEVAGVKFPSLDDDIVYQGPPGKKGVDDFSWGYQTLVQGFYDNPFGVPVTVTPRISFSHDVHGDTPGRYPFIEHRKAISAGVNVDYLGVWQFDLSYSNPFGAGTANGIHDRDWVSLSVTRSF
jgi:hypothetical protein